MRPLLLLVAGASVATSADAHSVLDSESLVQRAIASARPRGRVESGRKLESTMATELRVRTTLKSFIRKLGLPDWVSWGAITLLTTEIMTARNHLQARAKSMMDDILALNLPKTNYSNPQAVGQALGQLSKVFSNNDLETPALMLARLEVATPATLVALPKMPAVQRDARHDIMATGKVVLQSAMLKETENAESAIKEFHEAKDETVTALEVLARGWLSKLKKAGQDMLIDSAFKAGRHEFTDLYEAVRKTYGVDESEEGEEEKE